MQDESYIQIAIELAKKGKGYVSPDPLVGAVIVKNDKIIAVGYQDSVKTSAVAKAISNVKDNISASVLYTNIEYFNNDGDNTLVNEIINQKFKRVVVGTINPNPSENGKSIRKLKESGLEVRVGVLEKECSDLNKFYFKYVTKKSPYITLKFASTLDGKIADISGNSKWITSVESRSYVHRLRSEYDAVLVGKNTVKIDDPRLNVRLVEGRNPAAIILDSGLNLSLNYRIFKNPPKKLFIVTSKENRQKQIKLAKLEKLNIDVIYVKEDEKRRVNLRNAVKKLQKKKISSILVEGGSQVFTKFLTEKIYDELLVFYSPKLVGSGIPMISDLGILSIKNSKKFRIGNFEKIGDDLLVNYIKE